MLKREELLKMFEAAALSVMAFDCQRAA